MCFVILHSYQKLVIYLGSFLKSTGPLDFNEILVNGSVLNAVSIYNISFLRKSLFKKLSKFKVIFFVCNSEKKMKLSFFISIACFKKLFE